MQFSSRPPLNVDPKPYVDQWNIDRNADGDPAGYDFDAEFRFDPRPEFDRPQHNPTNPILADFRIANAGRILRTYPTTADLAAVWAEGLARDGRHSTLCRSLTEDQSHIDHARRVLTRLASLTNDKEN